MDFLLFFLVIWVLGIAWFLLFSINSMHVIRNIGFALFPLAAGLFAVGYLTAGFEDAHLGPLILIALALGMASLMLPMLALGNFF